MSRRKDWASLFVGKNIGTYGEYGAIEYSKLRSLGCLFCLHGPQTKVGEYVYSLRKDSLALLASTRRCTTQGST